MHTVRLLSPLVVLALVAACGGRQVAAPGAQPVEVRVRQVVDGSAGLYVEGAYSYVRVELPDGRKVLEERLPEPTGRGPTFTSQALLRLEPAEYRLVSFQRPCDGNCGYLDPPADSCARLFTVAAGEVRDLVVTVRPGRGCVVEPGSASAPG